MPDYRHINFQYQLPIRKKDVLVPFGNNTIEGLALDMYDSFHDEDHLNEGWVYGEASQDDVVMFYREAALLVNELRKHYGIGTLYDAR